MSLRDLVSSMLTIMSLSSCGQFIDGVVTSAISADESEVVAADIAKPMPGNPHGIMTELQPELPGDRERADNLAAEIEQGIARYRDIELAKEDGYEFSLPTRPPTCISSTWSISSTVRTRQTISIPPDPAVCSTSAPTTVRVGS